MLSKNTVFKGEAVPFVIELPNYRMPGIRNVAQLLWEKAKDFGDSILAAIASVKRELGRKWAFGMVVLQCVIAWLAAFLVSLIG